MAKPKISIVRYNTALHLNPGCCRFLAFQFSQYCFAHRECRCERMDTSSYVTVRTVPVAAEQFLARVR
jgi:hypothetical protein